MNKIELYNSCASHRVTVLGAYRYFPEDMLKSVQLKSIFAAAENHYWFQTFETHTGLGRVMYAIIAREERYAL